MPGYNVLYLATLVVFTFGALAFSVLALSYLRDRRRRGLLFPLFTVLCAVAFVISLVLRMTGDSPLATGLFLTRELATGLLPPLLLHLMWQQERAGLERRGAWRSAVIAFYPVAIAGAVVHGLTASELVTTDSSDWLDRLPALILCAAGLLGLAIQIGSKRILSPVEHRHRNW